MFPETGEAVQDSLLRPKWSFTPARPPSESVSHSMKRPFFSLSATLLSNETEEEDILRNHRRKALNSSHLRDPKKDSSSSDRVAATSIPTGTTHILTSSTNNLSSDFFGAKLRPVKPLEHRALSVSSTGSQQQPCAANFFSATPSAAATTSSNKVSAMYAGVQQRRKSLHERLSVQEAQATVGDDLVSFNQSSQAPQTAYSAQTQVSTPETLAPSIGPLRREYATNFINVDKEMAESYHRSSVELKKEEEESNIPPHCSRNSSIGSMTVEGKGMQGVVLEAIKTVQRYEEENEVQKTEIERLNAQLEAVEAEKSELLAKVESVKRMVADKINLASQNLEVLRNDFEALKAQSVQTFSFVDEARSLVDSLHNLKPSVENALEKCYLGEGLNASGNIDSLPPKARDVLAELKLDNANKQQVLDMLRERLTDICGDLANERNHLYELRETYAAECRTTQQALSDLKVADAKITELTAMSKEKERECLDYITRFEDLERQLEKAHLELASRVVVAKELEDSLQQNATLESRICEQSRIIENLEDTFQKLNITAEENARLKVTLEERNNRLLLSNESQNQAIILQEESTKLKTLLEERDRKITALQQELTQSEEQHDRITEFQARLVDKGSKIEILQLTTKAREDTIENLRICIGKLQSSLDRSEETLKYLQKELQACKEREELSNTALENLKTDNLILSNAKVEYERRISNADGQWQTALAAKEASQQQAEAANVKLQALQERFEEQSITLRLTRDSNAEFQDRLVAAASEYTKSLERNTTPLRLEIAVLQEQKVALQAQLKQERLLAEGNVAEVQAKHADLVNRMEQNQGAFDASSIGLRTELGILQERNKLLQTQLDEIKVEFQRCSEKSSAQEIQWQRRVENIKAAAAKEAEHSHIARQKADVDSEELKRQNEMLRSRNEVLQAKADKLDPSCTIHQSEIENLKQQIQQEQSAYKALKNRMDSMSARYDTGDLDFEEKTLIKKVMQATQSTHDQQMAQLRNEVRRKDGLINNLQKAKVTLEASLAKHIRYTKSSVVPTNGAFMEFVNWPSSQSELTQESDMYTAPNPDQTTTAPEEPAEDTPETTEPFSRSVAELSIPPPLPTLPSLHTSSMAIPVVESGHNFASPTTGTNRIYFSNLAPDTSDGVVRLNEDVRSVVDREDTSRPAKRTRSAKNGSAKDRVGKEQAKATTYTSKAKRKRKLQ